MQPELYSTSSNLISGIAWPGPETSGGSCCKCPERSWPTNASIPGGGRTAQEPLELQVVYPVQSTGCGGSSGSGERFQLLLQLAELVQTPTALHSVPFSPRPERPDRHHRRGPAVVELVCLRKSTGGVSSCNTGNASVSFSYTDT